MFNTIYIYNTWSNFILIELTLQYWIKFYSKLIYGYKIIEIFPVNILRSCCIIHALYANPKVAAIPGKCYPPTRLKRYYTLSAKIIPMKISAWAPVTLFLKHYWDFSHKNANDTLNSRRCISSWSKSRTRQVFSQMNWSNLIGFIIKKVNQFKSSFFMLRNNNIVKVTNLDKTF